MCNCTLVLIQLISDKGWNPPFLFLEMTHLAVVTGDIRDPNCHPPVRPRRNASGRTRSP